MNGFECVAFVWYTTCCLLIDSGTEQARRITAAPTTPIPELILSGDKAITLDPGLLTPLAAPIDSSMPVADLLLAQVADADRVVVGRVVERVAALTADQTWIVTIVRIRPEEWWKPRAGQSEVVLDVREQGGSLTIKGVSVSAVAGGRPALVADATYLLFIVGDGPDARVTWSYRIGSTQQLESTFPAFISGDAFDTAHGLTLDRARQIVRAQR